MDPDSQLSCFLIVILLALAAYFAVAETAFASVSYTRMKLIADRGDDRAKKALYILDNFQSAISTLLICTNVVHISVASMVTVMVTRLWGLSYVTISTIVTTLAVFFLGEMLPKSIAKKDPEKYALPCAGPICACMKLLAPIAALLARIGELAVKLSKKEPELSVTEDELHDIIEDMAEEGSIDEDQEDLISSVLEFTDVKTRNIYTPLEDVVALDISTPADEAFEFIRDQGHSRILIYRGDKSRVRGILQIRKYLKSYLQTGEIPDFRSMIDKPYYVSAGRPADELLSDMSDHRQNIAVVRNGKGEVLGIVSMEDILEELVGDILDEEDSQDGPSLQGSKIGKLLARRSVKPGAKAAARKAGEKR